MKKIIHERLQQLRKDQAKGEQVLAQIEEQKRELTNSLHRIQGAIQVLTGIVGEQRLAAVSGEDLVSNLFKDTSAPANYAKETAN